MNGRLFCVIFATLLLGTTNQCLLRTQTFGPNHATFSVAGVALAGISGTDAWYVQGMNAASGATVVIWHYNGASWSTVRTPAIPGSATWGTAYITSIKPIAANNVWAVGTGLGPSGYVPFIIHWNGWYWSTVGNPPDFAKIANLTSGVVAADTPSDVWISASTQTRSSYPIKQTVLLERWNGSAWKGVSAVYPPGVGSVSGTVSFSANDVWLSPGVTLPGYEVYHWNGATLAPQSLPPLYGASPHYIFSLGGTSSTDLWAAGQSWYGNGPPQAYFAHKSEYWSPFIVDTGGSDLLPNGIVEFRYNYAVAPEYEYVPPGGGVPSTSGLLVDNGYDRWRPTTSPFFTVPSQGCCVFYGPSQASLVPGTTSFWVVLTALGSTGAAFPALVVCPPNPPAGFN